MLASGVKVAANWLELMISLINAPVGLLLGRVDLTMFTAKFATILSHWFEVSRQGVNVVLPSGAVEVNSGCSGLESIVRLRLSVLL